MSAVAFVGGTTILPDRLLRQATVICDRGKIVSLETDCQPLYPCQVIDARGMYIAPGFVDIHVHGGGGADFMDGTVAAVKAACSAHLKHGTTTLFPTTTTGSKSEILAMIQACREAKLAQIAGIHLYGPYFAANKVGCHAASGRRDPIAVEFEEYFTTGQIKIATCAAELPGAEEFYRIAKKNRCLVTCGHSNASWSEMQRAFQCGMRHVDHFWCAMSSVPSLRERFGTPMQASMTEFVLMNREMSTEVIADGEHLSPELLEFAYQMIGPKRLCIVTDCNRGLDLSPGKYRFGNEKSGTWFESDGKVGRAMTGSLASSIMGMDHMVRHFRNTTSATLPDIIRMASLTPAERVGLGKKLGSIEVGKQADILLLDKQLRVKAVYKKGVQQSIE